MDELRRLIRSDAAAADCRGYGRHGDGNVACALDLRQLQFEQIMIPTPHGRYSAAQPGRWRRLDWPENSSDDQ